MILATGHGIEGLDARQLCNVTYARIMQGLDVKQREELLEELRAPLDPMAQWDQVMGRVG